MDCSLAGRKPLPLVASLAAAAAIAGCGGASSTSTESTAAATSTSAKTTTTSQSSARKTPYPYFGRVPERTHDSPDAPNPPFKFRWTFWAHQLIEFPPAVSHGNMFVLNKTGELYALGIADGKVLWQRNLGNNQTGPAYADGSVFVAQGNGDFTALDARTGKDRWTFHSPSGLQSSPLAIGGSEPPSDEQRSRPPRATLGRLLDQRGPQSLAMLVGDLADGAIIDTRVLMADRFGGDEDAWPVPADRFVSDLLRLADVSNSWLRSLTESASASRFPIALGAHTLVGPGVPLLLRDVGAKD